MINGTPGQHVRAMTAHILKGYQYFKFSNVARSTVIIVPSEILHIGLWLLLTEMKT